MPITRFRDRCEAGRRLAEALHRFRHGVGIVVVGLPRGGVPVASEVARALGAPLDVLSVRKLGLPGHPELAMGAIASGGIRVLNRDVIRQFAVSEQAIEQVAHRELAELARREDEFRGDAPALDVSGRTVILVDDGLATGATMSAAVAAVRTLWPRRVVVAVPVASREALRDLRRVADECVSVYEPEPFYGVGNWYADFSQTTDHEVRTLLAAAHRRPIAEVSR